MRNGDDDEQDTRVVRPWVDDRESTTIRVPLRFETNERSDSDVALEGRTVSGIGLIVPMVTSGPHVRPTEHEVPCPRRRILLGNSPECDVCIADQSVAPVHAAVYPLGDVWKVRGLRGNRVAMGSSMHTRRTIRPGDRFFLGRIPIEVVRSGERQLLQDRRTLTTMFMDLAGYTGLVGDLFPKFPRRHIGMLEQLESFAIELGLCVVKTQGDCVVMCDGLWEPQKHRGLDSLQRMVRCGIELARQLEDEHRLEPGSISFRAGAAIGELVVQDRDTLDLLGDSINLAARLESLCKVYRTPYLVERSVVAFSPGIAAQEIREIDWVAVKGRRELSSVYGASGPDDVAYRHALTAYRRGDFRKALDGFATLAESDSVAAAMRDRVEAILREWPNQKIERWNGVWIFEEK